MSKISCRLVLALCVLPNPTDNNLPVFVFKEAVDQFCCFILRIKSI